MSTPHANGLAASNGSPKLAVIDSSFAREAKIASRTIKAQDKLISDLKAEVEKQKNNVQENVSQIQQQSLRMEHLEHEISNVKQLNRSLMEDNESYQMLLHEKTINGEIMLNSFMQVAIQLMSWRWSLLIISCLNTVFSKSPSAPADEKAAGNQDIKPQPSQSTTTGLNLAAELNMASGPTGWDTSEKEESENDATIKSMFKMRFCYTSLSTSWLTVLKLSELNEEVKTLQDTNRALQLYMNKILMKIITDKQLVDVLSIDAPKPKVQEPEAKPLPKITGPMPSKTTSTGFLGRSSDSKAQRRRTISYWGSRANNPVVAALAEDDETKNDSEAVIEPPESATDLSSLSSNEKNLRRHSTLSEKANASANTGSWAKTLRRMTVMGWSSAPVKPEGEDLSDKEQEASSLRVSRSGSSSPSFRRSAERDSLGTLAEE